MLTKTVLTIASFLTTLTFANHENEVCFYTQVNFEGDSKCFPIGTNGDLCSLTNDGCGGKFNDKIRSVEFGSNVQKLELFEHSHFHTPLKTLIATTANLPSELHGFTSFRVKNTPTICVYTGTQFTGQQRCFEIESQADFCTQEFGGCRGPFNDKIRSIQYSRDGISVLLYKNANFQQYYTELKTQQAELTSYQDFTSLRVLNNNKACMYLEINYQGFSQQCFNVESIADFCATQFGGCGGAWNDKIQSIKFGSAVHLIVLFKDGNYKQYHTTLQSSTMNLNSQHRDFTSFWIA
jgi:Beta/Gamma crystallin